MDADVQEMHKRAALYYGEESACGSKIRYSEDSAARAAEAMTAKYQGTKALESYPCPWCESWHIGRQMTPEEQEMLSQPEA